ncbi:hypothetical protein [Brevibacillus laterosporus]|uniref:hypothetical protein n=1 Tax=Brevibacillus laterosporus TaxID=1465 RepID=UPI000E6D397B|nr:hypothetical protein [Brevibacillus laterosporus]AYB37555.1 hypothetical protein D5F52_04265 [Brevibacillus laterosporus]MBM7111348.1 hypothetical protein [Brevibacillus laterosporus]
MVNEFTGRNEIQAMENTYKQVLKWEEEFTKEIEELKQIEDEEAQKVAVELLKAWGDRKKIKSNVARSSNSKRIDRLQAKLMTLGYELIKNDWSNQIKITKLYLI